MVKEHSRHFVDCRLRDGETSLRGEEKSFRFCEKSLDHSDCSLNDEEHSQDRSDCSLEGAEHSLAISTAASAVEKIVTALENIFWMPKTAVGAIQTAV